MITRNDLVQKFRNQFFVNLPKDDALDQKIISEVQAMVKSDKALGEKELVLLTKKLEEISNTYRR